MNYKLIILLLSIALSSCSAKKNTEMTDFSSTFEGCPDGGTCNIEQIDNSSFTLVKDGVGQNYPQIENAENIDVYKITFQRKVDERIMDAQYQEVIYFQIDKKTTSKQLKDQDLSEVNLAYGRLCYCPGSTGYESISVGNLHFTRNGNQVSIQLKIAPQQFPNLMHTVDIQAKL